MGEEHILVGEELALLGKKLVLLGKKLVLLREGLGLVGKRLVLTAVLVVRMMRRGGRTLLGRFGMKTLSEDLIAEFRKLSLKSHHLIHEELDVVVE